MLLFVLRAENLKAGYMCNNRQFRWYNNLYHNPMLPMYINSPSLLLIPMF